MTDPSTNSHEGPDRGRLPVVTMLGAALSFFLFVVLVGLMYYIAKPAPNDDIAERTRQLKELRDSDQATLNSYGKTDKGYRVPIDRAIELLIKESAKQQKEAPK
jgi:hypothetical protein